MHPQFTTTLSDYGVFLAKYMRWKDAESSLRESLKLREKIEPDLWTTHTNMVFLGLTLMKQSKYEEAESLLIQGYEGLVKREPSIPENRKFRITQALDYLTQLYSETNKPKEVAKWRKELEAHQKKYPPPAPEKKP